MAICSPRAAAHGLLLHSTSSAFTSNSETYFGLHRALWRFIRLNSPSGACLLRTIPAVWWHPLRVKTQTSICVREWRTQWVPLRLRQLHLIKHTNDCSLWPALRQLSFLFLPTQRPDWLASLFHLLLASCFQ